MADSDWNKVQPEEVARPDGLAEDVVVSPDTLRSERVPPGQSRTLKWPVLDAAGPPRVDLATWRLEISGLVERPVKLTWADFNQLPKSSVFSDFHCVTRWSRLGNLWQGVATRDLAALTGALSPQARFVLVSGYDHGWTTNLPLDMFLATDAVVATHHDGQPISLEHGGPARLIVPRLYAWKSAKWIASIEFLQDDHPGFWERNGYHMNGDPWREERFGF